MKTIEQVIIGLVNNCNLRCPLCARQNKNHVNDKQYISITNLINFLEVLSNLKHIKLVGTISEPTLYPHLFELINYLTARSIDITISTNGSTHDESWWELLGKILPSNSNIIFAVDGSTQELHETYRVGSNLQKVLNNHKALKLHTYGKTSCQFIKFEHSIYDLPNVKQLSVLNNFDNFYDIHTGPSYLKQFQPIPEIKKYETIFKNNPNNISDIECWAKNNNQIYINHLGNVVICEFQDEEISKQIFKLNICEFQDERRIIEYINQFQYNKKCSIECGAIKRKIDDIILKKGL